MRTALFLALAVSLAVNFWMGRAVVRLENNYTATVVGMCHSPQTLGDAARFAVYRKCLDETETRTAWYLHLWYALQE